MPDPSCSARPSIRFLFTDKRFAPRFFPTLGHHHAVAFGFVRCDQLKGGLALPKVRPCQAHMKKAALRRLFNIDGTIYFFIASAFLPAASLAASAALPAASLAASAALAAASLDASAALLLLMPVPTEVLGAPIMALEAAAAAAVSTAEAAAEAASATAGAAAADAAAAAGASSFLPQAVTARAAIRVAIRSDLFIFFLNQKVDQLPVIVGTLQSNRRNKLAADAEPQRSKTKKARAFVD